MLLTRTARTAVDAACAIFARLEPLLDPCAQLVQSSHASSLCSTCVLLVRTTLTAVDAACAVSERLGPLLDPGSLADTNCPADATAYAVSERLGPLLDPGSLAGTNCPADATACVVMTRPTMFHIQQSCDSWLLQAPSKTSPRKFLVRAPR